MAIIQRNKRTKILAAYSFDIILPLIGEGRTHYFDTADGTFEVKLGRRRLRYFKEHPACVSCGRTGNLYLLLQNTFVRSKRTPQPPSYYQPYLNLYHKDADYNHYLLTIDHIKPVSLGGSDAYSNYQTMCMDCNGRKGTSYQQPEESQQC